MNTSALPRHVAIIMDGNGRWAKKNALRVALGHRKGVEALRAIIRESSDIGIEALSLYAFSTENWRRSPEEVEALMGLLLEYFTNEIDEWIIEAIKSIGLDTAKAVLNAPREMLIERADLEEDTVDDVLRVLKAEFEE